MARWSTCLRAPVYEIVRLRPIKNKANTSRVANRWGEDVACLVDEVTDDMSLDETTRKRKQVETASKKSSWAKVLKLADKTSKLRAITASPPPDWSVKRRVEYVTWAREVVAGLRGVNEWLEAEFDKAASAAEESIRP